MITAKLLERNKIQEAEFEEDYLEQMYAQQQTNSHSKNKRSNLPGLL